MAAWKHLSSLALKSRSMMLTHALMERMYISCKVGHPALLNINGHAVALVAHEPSTLESSLELLGADSVMPIEEFQVQELEGESGPVSEKTCIVVVPPGAQIDELLHALEGNLPWLQ